MVKQNVYSKADLSTVCPKCAGKSADGLLCGACTTDLREDMKALPEWLDYLEQVYSRQSQAGIGNGGKGSETAVPFDGSAAKVMARTRNVLSTWVRELDLGDGLPANTLNGMARWLRVRIERIRGHAAAGEIASGIHRVVKEIEAVVDSPPPRWYLGVCREFVTVDGEQIICKQQLYAPAGEEWFKCPHCSQLLHVETRRAEMLSLVDDQWAPLESCVNVLALFGLPAELRTIQRWAAMGHLAAVDGKYRVGDVADLARDLVAERVKGA